MIPDPGGHIRPRRHVVRTPAEHAAGTPPVSCAAAAALIDAAPDGASRASSTTIAMELRPALCSAAPRGFRRRAIPDPRRPRRSSDARGAVSAGTGIGGVFRDDTRACRSRRPTPRILVRQHDPSRSQRCVTCALTTAGRPAHRFHHDVGAHLGGRCEREHRSTHRPSRVVEAHARKMCLPAVK